MSKRYKTSRESRRFICVQHFHTLTYKPYMSISPGKIVTEISAWRLINNCSIESIHRNGNVKKKTQTLRLPEPPYIEEHIIKDLTHLSGDDGGVSVTVLSATSAVFSLLAGELRTSAFAGVVAFPCASMLPAAPGLADLLAAFTVSGGADCCCCC